MFDYPNNNIITKIHNKKYDSLIYESLIYVINNQIKKIGVLLYYYDNYDEIYKNIELIEKRKYDYVENSLFGELALKDF